VDGGEGEEGVAAVEAPTTVEGRTILRVGGAEFEVAALRDQTQEVDPLLSHWTAGSREGGAGAEGVGWVEGEGLEERIWEAPRVTSAVEGPRIIRWTRLTLRFSSGVS